MENQWFNHDREHTCISFFKKKIITPQREFSPDGIFMIGGQGRQNGGEKDRTPVREQRSPQTGGQENGQLLHLDLRPSTGKRLFAPPMEILASCVIKICLKPQGLGEPESGHDPKKTFLLLKRSQ